MVSHQLYLVSRNNNRLFFVVHHEGAFLCSQASCVIAHEIGKNITEQVILAESAICVTYSLPRNYQECTDNKELDPNVKVTSESKYWSTRLLHCHSKVVDRVRFNFVKQPRKVSSSAARRLGVPQRKISMVSSASRPITLATVGQLDHCTPTLVLR